VGRTGTCAVSPVVKRTATGLGNENEKRGFGVVSKSICTPSVLLLKEQQEER
tara:strand:+ start:495 stop:650 length:156 start_codon:yes stop_codon:yes gene_type:complete